MRQSKLLLYVIILAGLVSGYLFSSQNDPAAAVPELDARLQISTMSGLKDVTIDESILTDATFTSLRVFGELPVRPTGDGRDNPFQ